MPAAVVNTHSADSTVLSVTYGAMTGTAYIFSTTGLNSTAMTFTTGGDIHYLTVAAGGAGGAERFTGDSGGGGGAGGVLEGTSAVTTASALQITVGPGGTAAINATATPPGNGGNSVLDGAGLASAITAIGGGAGGWFLGVSSAGNGQNGGSGGGAASRAGTNDTAGTGTASQGNAGGTNDGTLGGAGGGGAGAAGSAGSELRIGGAGGDGVQSDITGTLTWYGGGGGGSTGLMSGTFSGGAGGQGGGGAGGQGGNSATAGVDGTGGGGGGAYWVSNAGGDVPQPGGSGIVVIFVEDAAGGTPHVEEPGADTLSLTGQAVTTKLDVTEVPSADTMSLSGLPVFANETLDAGVASLSLSGGAVTAIEDSVVVPIAGTLSLSGQPVSASAGFVETIDPDTIQYDPNQVIVPIQRATISLTGYAVDFATDAVIVIVNDAISMTGQDVTEVFQGFANPDADNLTLTGQAVSATAPPSPDKETKSMAITLFSAEGSASAVSSVIAPGPLWRNSNRAFQVDISSAATVVLQGRATPSMNWQDITSVTSSGVTEVTVMPEMRATITGNTGTVNAALDVAELNRFA